MNPDEAVKLYRTLKAAYPNTPLEPQNAELWVSVLADLDAEVGARIARQWIMNNRWFPTLADFVDLLDGEQHDLANPRAKEIAEAVVGIHRRNPWWRNGRELTKADETRIYRDALANEELQRLAREYKSAPADVLYGHLRGESNSLQYYERTRDGYDELEAG